MDTDPDSGSGLKKSFLAAYGAKIISGICSVGLTPFFLRFHPHDDFVPVAGLLLAQAMILILDLGISTYLVRTIGRTRKLSHQLFHSAALFYGFATLGFSGFILSSPQTFLPESQQNPKLILLLILGAGINLLLCGCSAALAGLNQQVLAGKLNALGAILRYPVAVLLTLGFKETAPAFLALNFFFGLIVLILMLRTVLHARQTGEERGIQWKEALAFSGCILASGVFLQWDRTQASLLPAHDFALYSALVVLMAQIISLANPAITVLLPRFSAHPEDPLNQEMGKKALNRIGLLLMGLALLAIPFRHIFLQVFFHETPKSGTILCFSALSIATALYLLSQFSYLWGLARGRLNLMSLAYLAGAGTGFGTFQYLGVPSLESLGAGVLAGTLGMHALALQVLPNQAGRRESIVYSVVLMGVGILHWTFK